MKWILIISLSVLAYSLIQMLLIALLKKKVRVNERLDNLRDQAVETPKVRRRRRRTGPRFSFIYVSKALEEEINRSGLKLRPEEYVMIWIALTFIPALLFYTIGANLIRSVALVIVGAIGPIIYLRIITKQRLVKFEKQLGDSLQILSNGLRAGFSFQQAMDNIAKDMPDPLGTEFRMASRELLLGADIEPTLIKISENMKSEDMRLVASAVVIQQRVGGNLADILDTISETIRDRLNIKRSIRTLTAQGRISGMIVGALPVVLLIAISVINPEYTSVFFSTFLGNLMLGMAVVLEAIGFLLIRKIVNIEM